MPRKSSTASFAKSIDREIQLLYRVQYPTYTEDQFAYFVAKCHHHGISPWSDHACLVSSPGIVRNEIKFVVKLEGLRSRATAGGNRWNRVGPFWSGATDKPAWRKAWTGKGFPFAAMVGIRRAGERHIQWATAPWSECSMHVMSDRGERQLAPFWHQRPSLMLAKVAEALALRATYPEQLAGLYTIDEIPPDASPRGDGLALPQVDDNTPETAEQLELMLVRDFEFAGTAERKAFVASMKSQHEHLFSTDRRRFYAAVIAAAAKINAGDVVGSA